MPPCRSCGEEWTFGVLEQALFLEKGHKHDPSRCKSCREERRKNSPRQDDSDDTRHKVVCADCGQDAHVPFVPRPGRPVYCRQCFLLQRRSG